MLGIVLFLCGLLVFQISSSSVPIKTEFTDISLNNQNNNNENKVSKDTSSIPNPQTNPKYIVTSRLFSRNPVGPSDHAYVFPKNMNSFNSIDSGRLASGVPRTWGHEVTLTKLGVQPVHPICSLSLLEIHEIPHPTNHVKFNWGSLDAKGVLKHVMSSITNMKYASLPLAPFHNVDGRTSEPAITTMGGDAGELLLAFNAFEAFLPQELTTKQLSLMLFDYLMNTDIPSLTLQVDTELLSNLCTLGCCLPQCQIDSPPDELIPKLLNVIVSPEFQGSAHFAHLLKLPEENFFNTRLELTKSFLESYFRLLWSVPLHKISPESLAFAQSKLTLTVLTGPHREKALVQVRTSSCHPSRIPMLSAENSFSSVFFIYEDAAQHRRAFNADWLAEMAGKMNLKDRRGYDKELLLAKMNKIANQQYVSALLLDDGKTPTFSLNFPSECCS